MLNLLWPISLSCFFAKFLNFVIGSVLCVLCGEATLNTQHIFLFLAQEI
jgi:hypothetical protein